MIVWAALAVRRTMLRVFSRNPLCVGRIDSEAVVMLAKCSRC